MQGTGINWWKGTTKYFKMEDFVGGTLVFCRRKFGIFGNFPTKRTK